MAGVIFTILICGVGILMFIGAFRAMLFANRNKERLPTVADRTTWWMRLFVKNGYGPDLERERRGLAIQVAVPAVLFFIGAAILRALY